MDGKTNGKMDDKVLKKLMEDYCGVKVEFAKLTDNGVTYNNLLLYLMDFITYSRLWHFCLTNPVILSLFKNTRYYIY